MINGSRSIVIALDARRLAGNLRGIGLQIYNLARFMPKLAPDIRFKLFVDRSLDADVIPPGCEMVVVGNRPSFESQSYSRPTTQLYSVYWMNVLVPIALRRERVDLFHGMNVAIPLAIATPCIVTIHDLISERLPETFSRFYVWYRRWLVSAVTKRAVKIVAVSESTRSDIIELFGVMPEKVVTVHPSADESLAPIADVQEQEHLRQRYDLPQSFVLAVGAVERQKRLVPLVSAAAQVIRKGLVDGLVLAGEEGRGSEEVRRAVAELGIAEKVRFLGYVPQESLPVLYSMARCSAYPSWYEGFGVPVLESMACGTPVITTNVSSLPEVAGDAALLVPPGDVQALAAALERLLSDEALRNELIERGLRRVKQFSWQRAAQQHVELYRRCLGQTVQVAASRGSDTILRH